MEVRFTGNAPCPTRCDYSTRRGTTGQGRKPKESEGYQQEYVHVTGMKDERPVPLATPLIYDEFPEREVAPRSRNQGTCAAGALNVERSEPGNPNGNRFQRQTGGGKFNGCARPRNTDRGFAETHPGKDVKLGLEERRPYRDVEWQGHGTDAFRRDRTIRRAHSRRARSG